MKALPLVVPWSLAALAGLQRLVELARSRRNLQRLSRDARAADSRGNFGALVALQALWLAGCALEPALRGVPPAPAVSWTGLVLFLAGAALRVACIVTLGVWWNARASVDPRLAVVSRGPYRFVRHPNYLGVLLELVGLPLLGGAWWTLALLAPAHLVVLARRMRGEDALLCGVPGYAETMGRKGALVPRLLRR